MHQQPVGWIGIQPSRANQSGYQFARFAVPLDPCLDGFIRVFTDIASGREAARKMPDCLQPTKHRTFGLSENGFKVCEFWVVWNCPECHQATPFPVFLTLCSLSRCVSFTDVPPFQFGLGS